MTLTAAIDIARSGLSVTAGRMAVVSRNVAGAGEPLASRKTANVVTMAGGGARIASVTGAANGALLQHIQAATSAAGRQGAIVTALDRLDQTVDDPELDSSPAALVARLANALQIYGAGPHDQVRAQTAVVAAADLVSALNTATGAVQTMRQEADADIANTVERLNALLHQLEAVNGAVVEGTRAGADVTDELDSRDRLLLAISEEVSIRTITRADNDLVVFTDSGAALLETRARAVSFARTPIYTPGTAGNPVYVDGVQITGAPGGMVAGGGRLVGLAQARDEISVVYQSQLDEIARGLIETFAESDQSAPATLADAPGLFTWPGAPAIPAAGSIVTGLAGSIRLAASVDPAQGGDPSRLRDGGIAGPAYLCNTTGAAAYGARLQQLFAALSEQRAFDPAAGLQTQATVAGLAAASVGWLEEARKSAGTEAEYRSTVLERASEAFSRATGVNLDEEMTVLLELERSYQATSRLIATIDGMYRSLLAAMG